LEIANKMGLIVILPVERAAPAGPRVQCELSQTAQEALTTQQQFGRETKIPPTKPFERAGGQAQPVAKLRYAGHLRIPKGGVAGGNEIFMRGWRSQLAEQESIDPLRDFIAR